MNLKDKCGICGHDMGYHHGDTLQCPEVIDGKSWLETRFNSGPLVPLPDLLAALGWQGGTVADALAEVRRLKADNLASCRFV